MLLIIILKKLGAIRACIQASTKPEDIITCQEELKSEKIEDTKNE